MTRSTWRAAARCALLTGTWIAAAAGASAAVAQTPPDPTTQATRWSVDLPRDATTSAGVFDAQQRLVRTLWRGEPMSAGAHAGTWDERDDHGQTVAPGRYEIALIHHRLAYVWEGVIGNSSDAFGGPQVHKAFMPPTDIVVTGGRAIYAVGYNEHQPALHGFVLAEPGKDTRPLAWIDPFTSFSMIAADATRLYWANTGGMSRSSFVGVLDLASARHAAFTAGRAVCLNRRPDGTRCYESQDYPSVIDLETQEARAPTGLAVQRAGRVLAVAHAATSTVRLFDKLTGEPLHEIIVPLAAKALNQIAMTPAGDLWVISGRSVLRFTDLERSPRQIASIDGGRAPLPQRLVHPIALATSPSNDDMLWVADGGTSQQLKRFERSRQGAYQQVTVIGREGGYASDPAVAPDKLCFRSREGREQTALAVVPGDALWVVDYCNNRMLRFRTSAAPAVRSDAQIAYEPGFYTSTVDHANPRRVFANFLEFDADTGPPQVSGRSWKLVRNWLAGLPAWLEDEFAFNAGFGGLTSVETLANGRTYGIVLAQKRQVLVELPGSGPLRVVKVFGAALPGATGKVMYENGDLGHAITGPSTQTAVRLPLTGFDAAGEPQWATEPIALATAPTSPGSPYFHGAFSGMPPRFPVTGSGRVVYFDQAVVGNEGFHLGAVQSGSTQSGGTQSPEPQWLWQASPSGPLDGKGSFQTKAIDGSTHYGGNAVWAHGRHIVYGYHGEFHRDLQTGRVGQANQFMHFDESGLFLGQFGQASTRPASPLQEGMSGNAFSPTLVRIGERLHLFHNDESSHGGVHRWRIDGWDNLRDMRGSGPTGSTIVLR